MTTAPKSISDPAGGVRGSTIGVGILRMGSKLVAITTEAGGSRRYLYAGDLLATDSPATGSAGDRLSVLIAGLSYLLRRTPSIGVYVNN